jgi:putative ABC transport system ATP-binding protein
MVIDVLRAATLDGCGLLLVTHDRDHANRMERVLRLENGALVEAQRRVPA